MHIYSVEINDKFDINGFFNLGRQGRFIVNKERIGLQTDNFACTYDFKFSIFLEV